MGVVVDYNPIAPLTGADLPPKLTAEDAAVKHTAAPPTLLAAGLKDNEIIDSVATVGGRLNSVIDTTELIGSRVNRLIEAVNWLGEHFENVELIGDRRYLAYVPEESVPTPPPAEETP